MDKRRRSAGRGRGGADGPATKGRPAPEPESAEPARRPWWHDRSLLGLLVAALAVKATVLAQLGGHPLLQPHGDLDTTYYIELGRRVAGGGPLAITEPFSVSPLYVYFLAAVFRVHDSLLAARIVQILLGTAAVGFLYLTARQWFDERVARVAGALAVLTGFFTFSEILILQAALDPVLTAGSLYFVSRTQIDDRRGPLVAAGVSMGLFALNRPNALAYGLFAIGLIAVVSWRRGVRSGAGGALRTSAGRAALVLASLLLVLVPNAARNYAVSGEAILISSHGGLNFFIGNNAEADGIYDRVPGITPSIAGQVRDATRVAETAEGGHLSASEVSAYFFQRAWAWIAANPGAALALFARKIALVLNKTNVPLNHSYAFYSRDETTLLRVLLVGPWMLMPLGLVGLLLVSVRREQPGFWVWASFIPIYGLSVAAFFVSDRYRMPLLVPLCATSAAALVWTLDRIRERRLAAVGAAAAALTVAAALTAWNFGLDDGLGGERTRKAVWLVEQGSYGEALGYVASISPRHSHPGVLRFQVGQALAAAGRYDDATGQLRGALEIDRGQPAIHLALGQAFLLAHRAAEAVPHLASALDAGFRPEVSGPWLVRALASSGRMEEAVKALTALPDEVVAASGTEIALEVGSLALELNAPAPAERWLRGVVAREPGRAEAQEKLAVALVMLGRAEDALAPIETACRLDPARASARLNLAVVYAQLGRVDEARVQGREALRLDPSEPRAAALLEALPPPVRR